MTIEVTVDATGAVVCNPEKKSKPKGKSTITWKLKTPGYDFVDMQFLEPQPAGGIFSNKKVKPDKITLDDDNPGGTVAVEYPYAITVVATSMKSERVTSSGLRAPETTRSPVIRNEPT
jgi:hypothetical protein